MGSLSRPSARAFIFFPGLKALQCDIRAEGSTDSASAVWVSGVALQPMQSAGAMRRVSSRKQCSRVGIVDLLRSAGGIDTATVVTKSRAAAAGGAAGTPPSLVAVETQEEQVGRWQRRQGTTYDAGILELWRRM